MRPHAVPQWVFTLGGEHENIIVCGDSTEQRAQQAKSTIRVRYMNVKGVCDRFSEQVTVRRGHSPDVPHGWLEHKGNGRRLDDNVKIKAAQKRAEDAAETK